MFFVQQLDLSGSHKRPSINLQVEQQLKDGDLQTQVDGGDAWAMMGDDGLMVSPMICRVVEVWY